jgi:ABC-type amino acid transport substrate-binding protein
LAEIIFHHGYTVWWDYRLVAGRNFRSQIEKELRLARAVIVLWCTKSVDSEWVQEEAYQAKQRDTLIPATIEPLELPLGFALSHTLALADWDGSPCSPALTPLWEQIAEKVGRPQLVNVEGLSQIERTWRRLGALPLSSFGLSADLDTQTTTSVKAGIARKQSSKAPRLTRAKHVERPMRVGCFLYPPFSDWTTNADPPLSPHVLRGPWSEVVLALCRRMGLQFYVEPISAPDFARSDATRPDLVMDLFKTDYRQGFFDFSDALYRIGLQGVCRAATPTITKDELVKGDPRIIVQEGEVGWEYAMRELTRAQKKGNIIRISSFKTFEVLDMLISGRYDLAISDEISCMHFLRGYVGDRPFRLAFDRPLQIFDTCLAVRKELAWDMAKVNALLGEIRNESQFLENEVLSLRGFEHVERCLLR